MRKLFLVLTLVLTLSGCTNSTLPPVPASEGDALITKEYIDENIYNFYLDLSGMGLTKIPNFSEIATAVQKEDILFLNLSNNNITEISEDLLVLNNLKELKIDNNQITKLENIRDINLLNTIDAYKNQITEIDLENLPALVSLDLAYNNLESDDIADLAKLTSLESLQIQHNQIDSIEGIDKLFNLEVLKLESNKLNNVDVLNNLRDLESVSLGNNQLSEEDIALWKTFNAEMKKGAGGTE